MLRYLTDAYKGLVQTVPEEAKTDEVFDLTEWLGEIVRQVDSSLLDEWEQLRHPDDLAAVAEASAVPAGRLARRATPGGLTANVRAFRVMVRNELFRWVELLGRGAYADLAAREGSGDWSERRLAEALAPYWDEHDAIGIGPTARAATLFRIDERQTPGRPPRSSTTRPATTTGPSAARPRPGRLPTKKAEPSSSSNPSPASPRSW